jgi:hypothetical protein
MKACIGVSVAIKSTTKGTTDRFYRRFALVINQKLPFTLVISSIGFHCAGNGSKKHQQ